MIDKADTAALRAQSLCEVCKRPTEMPAGCWREFCERADITSDDTAEQCWKIGYELARARAEAADSARINAVANEKAWHATAEKADRHAKAVETNFVRQVAKEIRRADAAKARAEAAEKALADRDVHWKRRIVDIVKAARNDHAALISMLVEDQSINALLDGPAAPPLPSAEQPTDVMLHCPRCAMQHIDAPEPGTDWTNPPHKSHKCHGCGTIWRPADRSTNGVSAARTRGKADTWPLPSAQQQETRHPVTVALEVWRRRAVHEEEWAAIRKLEHAASWEPASAQQQELSGAPARDVLTELLRLYDWRFELAERERDPRGWPDSVGLRTPEALEFWKETRRLLMQYGTEKKAAWEAARCVLAQGTAADRPPPARREAFHVALSRDARLTAKARERAAVAHNEKPPKTDVRPRCSAKTRKGNPCAMGAATKCGLCLQHAALAWDRYQSRERARSAPPAPSVSVDALPLSRAVVYAAYDRCRCHAGLAFRVGDSRWMCSDLLLGLAVPGSAHDEPVPFDSPGGPLGWPSERGHYSTRPAPAGPATASAEKQEVLRARRDALAEVYEDLAVRVAAANEALAPKKVEPPAPPRLQVVIGEASDGWHVVIATHPATSDFMQAPPGAASACMDTACGKKGFPATRFESVDQAHGHTFCIACLNAWPEPPPAAELPR